ncbi:MAG: sigma 54-interacting transcriptional regulator [Pseudomonadota bacterium]
MIELSLRKGQEEVMRYFLTKELTTVGRASHNDICLPDGAISRVHLTITRKEDKYFVTDKSTNGTFLNNERISTAELKMNDVVRVADWLIQVGSPPPEEEDTRSQDRDPTRVLSYRPDKHELVMERTMLSLDGPPSKMFAVTKSVFTIGKSRSCDVVLSDEYVSNTHCKIEYRGGTFTLKDLGSTNGTFVNGQRIGEIELKPNTAIEVGRTKVRFVSLEERARVEPASEAEFEGIHSNHPEMQRLFALIQRIAPSDATVLIQGETGSGKELVARALHNRSPRSHKAFVALNCGAISKDLIESELFGHEKGAFTSAHQQRKGAFELADEGTLFLDEVGELPLDLQPKLLRVLEAREIKRVGGTQAIPVDVRVLAATHRNLAREVQKGRFREDLFFRIFVVPLEIPSLRDRREDIPMLAEYFLRQELAAGRAKSPKTLDRGAVDLLIDYNWPGNVRELKNVVSRAILTCRTSTISTGDIQFAPMGATDPTHHDFDEKTLRVPETVTKTLKEIERDRIVTELERNAWNKKVTAKVLGIAKSTLHEKIRKYNITKDEN